ncbi:MAG: hypothetical protein EOQ39_02435 [Mesorhizobium sp.]|uniref:hypothetical protein n=1 Tax=unclassified Mesorhizobium TaxID=325217 RepID=UPI000FCC99CD|nr:MULTISPECIES: hypothetical protein [unclassified Mesorhizobium]RUU61204.1 hypothetical protein EOC99_20575 [Mesorhizobium sp. M7A.T.Ca.TU.009.01.1.1]RUU86159.1 hypothetical protein EOD03_08475 [Mesorhizobium sp. M7A.T.Ca.TU.009.01.1.2]RUT81971.1 hypothetical protein EOD15_32220 [Mesorhizobium sp. M7A.T.Ca.US.000.02.2.1]RUT85367.1 hypothetical protein EOD14_17610 [Mesorhizobium sp. M7A.T.Ca.US.000.02.1.1]RUT98660.1 hypothetical protein EOD12_23975 [Mesorhizobium sp. M7A.T.Ca.TU.009.02.1.1]
MHSLRLAVLAATAFIVWSVAPASALTMKECGETYRTAKEGGTLNGMDWTAFRKEKCATPAADSVSEDTVKTEPQTKKETSAAVAPTVVPAGVTFPTTLAAEFKTEKPAKARMKTCLQGYHGNKDAGTLNGLRWIQKGGGYYSLCNAKLKS